MAATAGKVSITPPLTTGPQVTTSKTDANGRYFASVPPGSYVVCVYDPAPKLLNPCTWSTQAPAFETSNSQAVVTRDVVLAKGAVLSVWVDDPQKLLKETKREIETDCRVQVVTTSGHREDAVITATSGSGREYRVAVPTGVLLNLTVSSLGLTIVDEAGKSAIGLTKQVQVLTEQDTPALRYTVTGVQQ
jgi:hypothetical protein